MYIRTKDGVYEYKQERIVVDNNKVKYQSVCVDGMHTWLKLEEVISQSENLEELCDNIVYNGYLYQNKIINNELVEDSFEELTLPIDEDMIKQGIYGSIWTDKGLIYVAKMNDKGELELI